MTKYNPLMQFLMKQPSQKRQLDLTLSQIEAIIGDSLPDSARKYAAWWANDTTHVQAKAWLEAEWRAQLGPGPAMVRFIR